MSGQKEMKTMLRTKSLKNYKIEKFINNIIVMAIEFIHNNLCLILISKYSINRIIQNLFTVDILRERLHQALEKV